MGLNIVLTPEFSNPAVHGEGHSDMVCRVKVHASIDWNCRPQFDYLQAPTVSSGAVVTLSRHKCGIGVDIRTGGRIAFFSFQALLQAIVQLIVLVTIPTNIMIFVCCYLLGFASKIYRRALCQPFDINAAVYQHVASMMGHMLDFQGLSSQAAKTASSLVGIHIDDVMGHLRVICRRHIEEGTLREDDIQELSHYVKTFAHQRTDGHICLEDWLESLSSNQLVEMRDLGSLFSLRRKRSIGERLFVPKLSVKRGLEHVEPEAFSVQVRKAHVVHDEITRLEFKFQEAIDAAESRLKAMLDTALEQQAMRLEQLAQSSGAPAGYCLSTSHVSEMFGSQKTCTVERVNRSTDEALDALVARFELLMEDRVNKYVDDARSMLCKMHELEAHMNIAIEEFCIGIAREGCAITTDVAGKDSITTAKCATDASTSKWRASHTTARSYTYPPSGTSILMEINTSNTSDTGTVSNHIDHLRTTIARMKARL
eukprot:TRINITY_DN11156_c0_g1_i1.p1 TRINITY_DN11156_c0_g1~~TRINITY_DN11156_c0_g1_i1.p1  ORF type:complete len:493 (-),score=44.58 TRINITY_DN11156_c0_g1_i1:597-2045(-)